MASKKTRMGSGSSGGNDITRDPLKVVIYSGELAQIEQWVRRHPNIETGGDLFGLWSKDNTAVIQLVLGPGKDSHRTTVSFFQDAQYLGKAGSHLTEQYGLCHIGEWHSHHSLDLAYPSSGDQNTVWTNMPKCGFKRFLVFIANLDREKPSRKSTTIPDLPVGLGCFLFEVKDTRTWERHEMLQGSFEVIEGQGPYRQLHTLSDEIKKDAESTNPHSEVTFETEQSRSRRYEGSNILMYRKKEGRGQDYQPTTKKPMSVRTNSVVHPQNASSSADARTRNKGNPTETFQPEDKQRRPMTVSIDPREFTEATCLWETLEYYQQNFFQRLSGVFNGQPVKEVDTVTIQFQVSLSGGAELACRLVFHEDHQDVLRLYPTGSAKLHYDVNMPKVNPDHSPDSQIQFVKEEVAKQVQKHASEIFPREHLGAAQQPGLQPKDNHKGKKQTRTSTHPDDNLHVNSNEERHAGTYTSEHMDPLQQERQHSTKNGTHAHPQKGQKGKHKQNQQNHSQQEQKRHCQQGQGGQHQQEQKDRRLQYHKSSQTNSQDRTSAGSSYQGAETSMQQKPAGTANKAVSQEQTDKPQ